MKIAMKITLVILVLLAVSSGITKIMLMPQELEFFGKYGFSNPLLITFGFVQLVGGVLLMISKSRLYGAVIVAITFIISLVLLVMDNNYPVAAITALAIALLVWVAKPDKTV